MVPGRNVGRVRTEISMVLTVVLVLKKKKTKKKICSTEVYKGRRNFDYVRQNSGTDNISSLDVVRRWLTQFILTSGEEKRNTVCWYEPGCPRRMRKMEESSLTQTQELKLLKNCSGLQFSSFLIFFPFQNLKARKEYAIPHATLQQTLSLKKKKFKERFDFFLEAPKKS